jgi:hypothetical protein
MARWARRPARRPTTAERGYGGAHEALRKRWEPKVAAGKAYCHEPVCIKADRWIEPGSEWDLAHQDDRRYYRGPAHRECNAEEARRRRAGPAGPVPFRRSQQW